MDCKLLKLCKDNKHLHKCASTTCMNETQRIIRIKRRVCVMNEWWGIVCVNGDDNENNMEMIIGMRKKRTIGLTLQLTAVKTGIRWIVEMRETIKHESN